MIKLYFKQAWQMLKEEKLFSTLYVVGTGFAITLTMIIAIVYYIRLAPVYPETARNRILVWKSASIMTDNWQHSSAISYKVLKEWLYPLKGVEAVAGIYSNDGDENFVQPADGGEEIPAIVKYTDENFFRVFSFTFLDGKPFSASDRISGIRKAVISDEYAHRLFGTSENVVGKHFSLDFTDTQIVGVLTGGSYLTPVSYGQIYLPYSCLDGYDRAQMDVLGSFNAYIKVGEDINLVNVKTQVHELVRKYNASRKQEEGQLKIQDQPETYWVSTFHIYSNVGVEWGKIIGGFAIVFAGLLFVPALNLSGMISHRMERRLPEMGVRKAFGASRNGLLKQVIWENFVLSGLGGLLGLVLAWIVLGLSGYTVFSFLDTYPDAVPEGVNIWYGSDMLFAPMVFLVALLFCIALNLLSALIPAYRSLRKNIVYSLNEKR